MATSAGGLDAIVFSGGIGEGAASIRAQVAERLGWTGLVLDPAANATSAEQIHATASAVSAFVIHVDEEAELALAALAFRPQ
jgi:acetate kinase